MLRRFLADQRGNYALITVITMIPLMGAVAVGVDYTEMNRQYQYTQHALDAAGVATAYRYLQGADNTVLTSYANSFFDANLGPVKPANTTLTVTLPASDSGGGTLGMTATLRYRPYFYPVFLALLGKDSSSLDSKLNFNVSTEVRLKDTLEVALVLDNSGSMSNRGSGSGQKRIDLLKSASKELVTTLVNSAAQVKQVDKPVQFGLVPFAASVNVGPQNASAGWMDTDGISPIHHENFDWSSFTNPNRQVKQINGIYYKVGKDWGLQENQKVTRFTLYNEMKYYTNSGQTKKANYTSWQGCVEQRPSPFDVTDAAPDKSNPATLFVPMFAPDETSGAQNNWYLFRKNYTDYYWNDVSTSNSAKTRQSYMPKYFDIPTTGYVAPYGTSPAGMNAGPNASCTTQPITPLTDVTTDAGMKTITDAIDAMQPSGGTSVPSGLAWGWRVVSSGAPFTEGRPESERGNDKVVIVLTDGANTYYTPQSLGYSDPADNESIYSDYGYTGKNYNGGSTTRLYMGTDDNVEKDTFSNDNYTEALNEKMSTLCENAKASKIILMTVSLDLNQNDKTEKTQMDALKACSSESRFRIDPATGKPAKLYWNATGASLSDDFKAIANELSNLRIIG
ncbi:pilus assembly protein [Mesorhizobium koreense]|uniref:pilus assembly protein n=1 Tax=Mesorhizobium koreense TaxID=3074855 RepID=UPI00287B7F9E|nr:pilus assembly protein [Mesorhizobium sp. WR6]